MAINIVNRKLVQLEILEFQTILFNFIEYEVDCFLLPNLSDNCFLAVFRICRWNICNVVVFISTQFRALSFIYFPRNELSSSDYFSHFAIASHFHYILWFPNQGIFKQKLQIPIFQTFWKFIVISNESQVMEKRKKINKITWGCAEGIATRLSAGLCINKVKFIQTLL